MEVYEKINLLIKEKKITKRAFSNSLRFLEPRLKTTGEIPSENTIYSYLSGRISIPIELVPYITETLNITEQELFDNSDISIKRCFNVFVKNAKVSKLLYLLKSIKQRLENNTNNDDIKIENLEQKIDNIVALLKYAPSNFLDKVIMKLEEYKKMDDKLID